MCICQQVVAMISSVLESTTFNQCNDGFSCQDLRLRSLDYLVLWSLQRIVNLKEVIARLCESVKLHRQY